MRFRNNPGGGGGMKRLIFMGIILGLCARHAYAEKFTEHFYSPDKSCHLFYEGAEDHGEGTFYDMSGGKKVPIHKEYVRIGPIVNWPSNAIAEFFISEGSPAYHSTYYDCKLKRTSPAYFLTIAFNPATRIIAALTDGEIEFFRLFDKKPFFKAKAPGAGLIEYFDCDSDAVFDAPDTLHLTMKCAKGFDNIDLKIKIPQKA